MNIEDKKKLLIIILAVGAGLMASVLTGQYINKNVEEKTVELTREFQQKTIQPLAQEVEALKIENRKMMAMQQSLAQNQVSINDSSPLSVTQPQTAPAMSLAVKTPAGKRAMTVQIDSLSAVGGLVNPGDYVDVLARLAIPGSSENLTVMVFQNIQILAVGPNVQPPVATAVAYDAQQRAATLHLTFAFEPEEAALMSFAQQHGKLQLVLRSPAETQSQTLQAATWETLSDYVLEKSGTDMSPPKSRAIVQPATQEIKPHIQIFRGGREL